MIGLISAMKEAANGRHANMLLMMIDDGDDDTHSRDGVFQPPHATSSMSHFIAPASLYLPSPDDTSEAGDFIHYHDASGRLPATCEM